MRNLIIPTISLRTALRIRPLMLELLEKYGVIPWDHMDKRLEDFFALFGLDAGLFLREMSWLEIPDADTAWDEVPLYYLCDRLTENHRTFLLEDIPDISHLLDVHSVPATPEGMRIRELQSDFKTFIQFLILHLEDKEEFLFPKILRNEACLRDPKVHPQFHLGSVHVHLATKFSNQEHLSHKPLERIREKTWRLLGEEPTSFVSQTLLDLVQAFESKLGDHRRLEHESLYVRARRTERDLYNRSIRGEVTGSRRRDPRDSGILRLTPL